jgi:hypothetical protein
MKSYLPFILIMSFLFPVLGHAATVPQPAIITPAPINIVNKGFLDSYTRLVSLAGQTQLALNQLTAAGLVTDSAQTALTAANTSLAKAKIDNAAKSIVNKAQIDLAEAKAHLIDSLTALKAALPTLDTSTQS